MKEFDKTAEFLKPRLRLFLSVDLVGSTSLKQGGSLPIRSADDPTVQKNIGAEWFRPISEFYRNVERIFFRHWAEYKDKISSKYSWSVGSSPRLWKANGDELLYVKEINDEQEAWACLGCWIRTIIEYRGILRKTHPKMNVKGSAWTAGFPFSNIEVIFRNNPGQSDYSSDSGHPHFVNYYLLNEYYKKNKKKEFTIDYIGPSIDTGFRLSAIATPRKFVISLELAFIASYVPIDAEYEKEIQIRYDGTKELKGVLGGKPYPILWIDTMISDQLTNHEDAISPNRPMKIEKSDVADFCQSYIKDNPSYLFRPFMINSGNETFKKYPEGYVNKINEWQGIWENEREKLNIEQRSVAGEAPSGTGEVEETANSGDVKRFAAAIAPKKPRRRGRRGGRRRSRSKDPTGAA